MQKIGLNIDNMQIICHQLPQFLNISLSRKPVKSLCQIESKNLHINRIFAVMLANVWYLQQCMLCSTSFQKTNLLSSKFLYKQKKQTGQKWVSQNNETKSMLSVSANERL